MGKKPETQPVQELKTHKKTKYNRFEDVDQVDVDKKNTWPSDAVVYIGHLPHGFYEDQLQSYFTQYGQVLGVKVARSKKTARSKGYAFIQFKYPEVAAIVADAMNGYLLLGKVLVSNVLSPKHKNPFNFSTSKKFKFINWKRLFMKQQNRERSEEEMAKQVKGLLKNEEERKQRLKKMGINYEYSGFSSHVA